jgi:ribosome-associated heat shock protein Hsp15
MTGTARVDAWIWVVRAVKTRSAATAACKAGHVSVNDERAKPAQPVKPGDIVRVRLEGTERILQVAGLLTKRVSATVAAVNFVDLTPPAPPREERILTVQRERGAGRPTKRDRRDIDKLMHRSVDDL